MGAGAEEGRMIGTESAADAGDKTNAKADAKAATPRET